MTITGSRSAGTTIQGNFIGTNAAGTAILNNGDHGVWIVGTPNTLIGGTAPGAGNLISGNLLLGGIEIQGFSGATAAGNRIQGNLIGTNASGTGAIANGAGIFVNGAASTVIGGTEAGAGNLISGNSANGVSIFGLNAAGTVVQGNLVGTNAAGTAPLGNGGTGVLLDVANATVGGTATGAGNTIAFNAFEGVVVSDINEAGNAIRANRIFSNGGLGIDLGSPPTGVIRGNGLTPNDPSDSDGGANNLQNFPVLSSASRTPSGTAVGGTLDSIPGGTFHLDVYASAGCDASGNGEGQTYLGTASIGNGAFAVTVPGTAPVDLPIITATATNAATNDTSEFSACQTVQGPGFLVAPTSGLVTTEAGGQATFTVRLTTVPTANVTVGLSSSDASEGAVAPPSLTFAPANALTPQTVTVTGVDDAPVDGNVAYAIVTAPAASTDPAYNGPNPPDVAVTNQDNDTNCSQRPPVVIRTTPEGGRLKVEVLATIRLDISNNRLNELRFRPGTNVLIDIGNQTGRTGTFTFPLPDRPAAFTFHVRRATAGQPTTLPFDVKDDCDPWPTFVGGGQAAGF